MNNTASHKPFKGAATFYSRSGRSVNTPFAPSRYLELSASTFLIFRPTSDVCLKSSNTIDVMKELMSNQALPEIFQLFKSLLYKSFVFVDLLYILLVYHCNTDTSFTFFLWVIKFKYECQSFSTTIVGWIPTVALQF